MRTKGVSGISSRFPSYPSLTGRLPTCYSPIRRSFHRSSPRRERPLPALDLHVLGTPPAFVLSQDQTLHKSKSLYKIRFRIYLANFRQVKKLFFRKQLLIYYRCVVQFSRNVFINLLVTTATNIS